MSRSLVTLVGACLLVAGLAIDSPSSAGLVLDEIAPDAKLELRLYRALIDVRTHDEPGVRLTADLLDYDDYRETGVETVLRPVFRLRSTQDGGRHVVQGETTRELVRVSIEAPPPIGLRIDVNHYGEVRMSGRSSAVDVRLFQGTVELLEQQASATVEIVRDGNIHAELTQERPARPSAFSNFDGAIELRLPARVRARLDVDSWTGDVYNELEGASSAEETPILVRTTKGKIRILVRGEKSEE